jgi:PhoPQ-activated pathogenicity-related protein
MLKATPRLIGITLMILSTLAIAKPDCKKTFVEKSEQALACYLAEPENIDKPWVLNSKRYDDTRKVSIETYNLISQHWPKADMSSHGILWKHSLILYQPDIVKTNQALLFVNGGTRYPNSHGDNPPPHPLDFARIAAETNSIVIDLHDIPNQYLFFDDNVPRKEDSIVAYTWNRYMNNPDSGVYWPIHLPMTKAIIKAMDAAQQITAQNNIRIQYFVVAGASKRGLATWLAALSDERINAIIPIVIDILNTKENLDLIYSSYNNHWPPAFHDYMEEKIPDRINTVEFTRLMQIEDPLAYLTSGNGSLYKKRLAIPKYIISASGDDFFAPDSLSLYLDKLPGENKVRVVPNQSHHIDMKIVENAILSYYQTITKHTPRPSLTWKTNAAGKLVNVVTNRQASSVKLWEAENPDMRDFRLAAHITYSATELKGHCINHHCQYPVTIQSPTKGWKASFVEVIFHDAEKEPLVLTTPISITNNE